MLRVDIKLRLDFNQLPLKMQKRSFHVLLINKTRHSSTINSPSVRNVLGICLFEVYFISKFFNLYFKM